MADALDIGAIFDVLSDLGIAAMPQITDRDAVRGVLVKCEPTLYLGEEAVKMRDEIWTRIRAS